MSALIPTSQVPAAVAAVVVTFGVAAVYLFIGMRLAARPVSPPSRLASVQFALWWGGLGASVGLGGLELLLAVSGLLPFAAAMTIYLLTILVDCTFLWGLVGFLTYVYTGKYHLVEVSTLYAGFYIAFLYWFFAQSPTGVVFEAAQPVWRYGAPANIPLALVLVVLLIGPEIVGAILYLSLRMRTKDPAQRYRILFVGGGILLWFGLDIFIPATTIGWLLARSILLVIPGAMSLIAYFPPEWARRRYGVTPMPIDLAEAREGTARA